MTQSLWGERELSETLLYMHNRKQEILFYSPKNEACYEWKDIWSGINEIVSCFQLGEKSAGGLVFGYGYEHREDEDHLKIWACNPITGKIRQLPSIVNDTMMKVMTMHSIRDPSSSKDSYDLLVCGIVYNSVRRKTAAYLYNSLSNSWEVVTDPDVRSYMYTIALDSFGQKDGKILCLDLGFCIYGFHELFWRVACYNINGKKWSYYRIQAWASQPLRALCRWKIFERDGQIILVVIFRDQKYNCRRGQVWNALIPREAGQYTLWRHLTTMPDAIFQRFVGKAGKCHQEKQSSSLTPFKFQEVNNCGMEFDFKAFAVPDTLDGDRLVLVSTTTKEIVTFNFRIKPLLQAWTISPFSAVKLVYNPHKRPSSEAAFAECPIPDKPRTSELPSFGRFMAESHSAGFYFQPDPHINP